MTRLDTILSWGSFALVCVAVLVAPWFFGAWEMWWFWPFATCIFAAACLSCARATLGSVEVLTIRMARSKPAAVVAVGSALFLLYAFVRMLQADVYMTAERSFLLYLTPFLLAAVLIRGQSRGQLDLLYRLVAIDLCLLALYGMLNHYLTGSHKVMWVVSQYSQYEGRATGPYFCPDHFSGLMELLLALALGVLLGTVKRESRRDPYSRSQKKTALRIVAASVALLALRAIWLTKSRGGGLTVLAELAFAAAWGTARLPPGQRLAWRAASIAATAAVIAAFCWFGSAYVARYKEFVSLDLMRGKSAAEIATTMRATFSNDSRYNMYSAAIRAWRTKPWFGIGPGMHQHLWPHFAASPDGDRARGIRPSRLNANYHSYEVHSDWLQLLEEYGLVGAALFIAAAGALFLLLARPAARGRADVVALGGSLSLVCMMFHSFVDFNLQIPATTWMLAAILSMAAARILREDT